MELYAIKYGEAPFPLKYIYRDQAESTEELPTDWLFYLAITDERVMLFDTGFRDAGQAAEWKLTFTDYFQELQCLLRGKPVDIVAVTHSHFDHIDNLDLYPGAKVIIAREAFDQAKAESPETIRRRLDDGAVTLVDDELIIEGVFRFKVIGGHESGSSVAYFTGLGKNYVLTGDECYACGNVLENRPIGSIFADAEKNTAFTLDAHRRGLIPLPCHDKAVFDSFPRHSKNIARIV